MGSSPAVIGMQPCTVFVTFVSAAGFVLSPHGTPRAGPCTLRAGHRTCATSMNFFEKFMQDLDDFMDDASSRRLGNGAKFYGKRKSNFYGEDDSMRKSDPRKDNAEEDYSGPGGGSYFVLSKERDEKGRPMGFLT